MLAFHKVIVLLLVFTFFLHLQRCRVQERLDDALDLEEATEPPDLEEGLTNNNTDDEEVPPLDSGVCALGGVAVGALTDDNVLLLVLDLVEELRKALD